MFYFDDDFRQYSLWVRPLKPFQCWIFWAVFLRYRVGIFERIDCKFLLKRIFFNACFWHEEIFFFNFFRKVPKSRCHGYQLAEILRYHQFQPLFTIFMTLLEKKIQRNHQGCNWKPAYRPCLIQQINNVLDLKHNDYWYHHINGKCTC